MLRRSLPIASLVAALFAIAPAAASAATTWKSVSTGQGLTCGIRSDDTAACWGNVAQSGGNVPPGTYRSISAQGSACGIKTDGSAVCWGNGSYQSGLMNPPAGPFTDVTTGTGHACALRVDGTIACWGYNGDGELNAPAGQFGSISAANFFTCAVRLSDGRPLCWGGNPPGGSNTPPAWGTWASVEGGGIHSCGVTTGGDVGCWGVGLYGENSPPAGVKFKSVSSGYFNTCGIRASDDGISCWGDNTYGESGAPGGAFKQVSAGFHHTCAVAMDDTVACWGNDSAATTVPGAPPADTTPPVITPVVSGTKDAAGVYTSDVAIHWDVSDPDSPVNATTGCGDATVTADTNGTTFTCSATSSGGTSTKSVTIMRSAPTGDTAPQLIGRWDFASGSTHELTGNWSSFQLQGNATISPTTGLDVNGNGNGANAATGWAVADGYSGPAITDKTLIAWVNIDDTSIRSGSPLSLYNPSNNNFDAIDYAENDPYQWMAGSDFFRRTQAFSPGQVDNAGPNVTRQIAIAYKSTGNGNETISGCLNGQSLGQYSTPNAEAFGAQVQALFGPRHRVNSAGYEPIGSIDAHILESRVYSGALTCSQAGALVRDAAPTDTTPPTTTADAPSGWQNHAVTVTLTATDDAGGSGVASTHYSVDGGADQTGTSVSVSGDGTHSVSYYSVDKAGNTETAHTVTVKIDTTAPVITATRTPANGAGWNNGPVTIKYSCTDQGGSGVASCPADQVFSTDGANQTASGEAVDQAGNHATATISNINIDTAKPVVALTGGGSYTIDQDVTIDCSATDALSGIASSTCSSVSGTKSALSYAVGSTLITATAADKAGNVGSGSTTVTVSVTPDSLCAVTTRFLTKKQLANSMCVKIAHGDFEPFRNEVSAQSGKAFSTTDANTLIALSKFLG